MSRLEQLYLILLTVFAMQGADIHHGYAPRYAPGVMERVSRVRHLPRVACMVSSPRYPIGTWLIVVGVNTNVVERCRVTDVSQTRDRARHLRTKREVELGYTEALRICGQAAMRKRPESCPVVVVKLPERGIE